jgi:hypothetical protein
MPANQDFKEIFRIFNEEGVEYLIVGAHAVMFYTEPRYTKDIDILVNPTVENALKTWNALAKFGAPLKDISKTDFTDKDLIYQIGIEPNRIDIIMSIAGVEFNEAWQSRQISSYDGTPIAILSKENLIKAKKASGRKQDIIDVERLYSIRVKYVSQQKGHSGASGL